jgi:glucan biosynthesis protein C
MKYVASRWLPARISDNWDRLINGVIRSERPFVPSPLLVVATFVAIVRMNMPGIDTPGSFIPDASIFACYFMFFWLGTRLHVLREIVPDLQRTAGRRLLRAAMFALIYIIACIVWFDGLTKTGAAPYGAFVVAQAALSLAIWPLILGGAGLAERWITREIPLIRYLSNSAYWIYLTHLPLCIGIAVLLRETPFSAFTKCAITIGATMAVCLVTYEAVRNVIHAARTR